MVTSMEEKSKIEINQALPQDAKDKLSEISARIKLARESIDRIGKPQEEKKSSMIRRVFVSLIALPIVLALFIVTGYLAVWLILNPLTASQMSGISIALIVGYAVFLTPKRSK